MQHRINNLLKIEEEHEKTNNKLFEHQALFKRWFDKHVVVNMDF